MTGNALFALIVLFGGIALIVSTIRQRRAQQELATRRTAELEAALTTSKRAAEEDVTRFGEELQRLDVEVSGHPLDTAMRQDYERALDAYDNAKKSLDAVKQADEIRHVTSILEDGRYAIACVNARVEGRPLPQKRPPCFFNPAHGPSTESVQWAPDGGALREVPACAADAERVKAGADPYIRTVQVGAQRVPYWQGGPAYAPWAQGYYTGWRGSDMIRDMAMMSMIFNSPYLFMGMGEGIGALGEGLGEGFSELGAGVGDVFGGLGDGFEELGSGVGDMFDGIGDAFGGFFD